MLVRDAEAQGIEVFVLRRTAAAAFAAEMYVFPGGRVDDADASAAIAQYCDGLDDATASARLGVESGGMAFWVAAVRECLEEAGVLLAQRRDGAPATIADADRRAVHAGELSMAELCRREELRLDLGAMRYVAHWVTPVGEARRFDTRFFLAVAPKGQDGVHDNTELVDSMWVRPADALAQVEARSLRMLPPTVAVLRLIAGCSSVTETMEVADTIGTPELVQPRLRRDATGRISGIALPDDPDYASLA